MTFVVNVLTNIPVWVYALFMMQVWIGWRSSRNRNSSLIIYYLLPLLIFLSIDQVLGMAYREVAWAAFLIGTLVGVYTGYKLQNRWILSKVGREIRLAGEWFTMTTLMIIFWANFANGLLSHVAPQITADIRFVAVLTFILSWASGSFLGRSLKVIFA
ncbi:MAG: hypothetical protein AAF478_05455 [Pseudomonadota bacterium]